MANLAIGAYQMLISYNLESWPVKFDTSVTTMVNKIEIDEQLRQDALEMPIVTLY